MLCKFQKLGTFNFLKDMKQLVLIKGWNSSDYILKSRFYILNYEC